MKRILLFIGITIFGITGHSQGVTYNLDQQTVWTELSADSITVKTLKVDTIKDNNDSKITFQIGNSTIADYTATLATFYDNVIFDSVARFGDVDIRGSIYSNSTELIDLSIPLNTILFKESIGISENDTIFLDANTNKDTYLTIFNNNVRFVVGNITVQTLVSSFFQTIDHFPASSNVYDQGSIARNWNNIFIGGSFFNGSTEIMDIDTDTVHFKIEAEFEDSTFFNTYSEFQGTVKLEDTLFSVLGQMVLDSTLYGWHSISLADDEVFNLPDASTLIGRAFAVGHAAFITAYTVRDDGTTTVVGVGNVANSDSDGNLCVFDLDAGGGGAQSGIKNRLGARVVVTFEIIKAEQE